MARRKLQPHVIAGGVLVLGAFAGGSCSRSTEEAIGAARHAYREAIEAEAERYSPESLGVASAALELALSEVAAQRKKLVPFRDYARAHALLGQARQAARGARYEALARREELRRQTAPLLEQASRKLAAVEESGPLLSQYLEKPAQEAWFRSFRAASAALAEADRAYREGDYDDAQRNAARALEELDAIGASEPSS